MTLNPISVLMLLLIKTLLSTGGDDPLLNEHSTSEAPRREVSGSFSPIGPPLSPPERIDAGESCIVNVKQSYTVSGSLSGAFQIDFRILVKGPCGSSPGTFDEQWIAHGEFIGTLDGAESACKLSYVAVVNHGGRVKGRIVLGQGLKGDVEVEGRFSDGELRYEGWAQAQ